jgi:pimeloyl-ACP methyl ester carboxylesterase
MRSTGLLEDHTTAHSPLRPPSLSRLALEFVLPPIEWGGMVAGSPILATAPRGDGHTVLLLPGFTASSHSMAPLRSVLTALGHQARGWGQGYNFGPHRRIVEGLTRRLVNLHRDSGGKVSLVGWSLGGMYARELARRHGDIVRDVITMASPFRMTRVDRSRASWWYDILGPEYDGLLNLSVNEQHREPVPVPCTSIYSRNDGIVRWHVCIDEGGPNRENIEVRGSHSGLGQNLAALYAVCDRLAQPEGRWQQFSPPLALRHLYPKPALWRDVRAVV